MPTRARPPPLHPHFTPQPLQVRDKLPLDGNAAAFFKCVGELAVHALDLQHARELFVEAVPLFREVQARDISMCLHAIRPIVFL